MVFLFTSIRAVAGHIDKGKVAERRIPEQEINSREKLSLDCPESSSITPSGGQVAENNVFPLSSTNAELNLETSRLRRLSRRRCDNCRPYHI